MALPDVRALVAAGPDANDFPRLPCLHLLREDAAVGGEDWCASALLAQPSLPACGSRARDGSCDAAIAPEDGTSTGPRVVMRVMDAPALVQVDVLAHAALNWRHAVPFHTVPRLCAAAREPGVRITVCAVNDASVAAVEAGLTLLGRSVVHREYARTWQLDAARFDAAVDARDVEAAVMDFDALGVRLGVPPDMCLDVLRPDEAGVLQSAWKYARGIASLRRIQESIIKLPSICLRQRTLGAPTAAAGSDLVGWMVTRVDGSYGVLHVCPEYRGQGLAKFMVRAALLQFARWKRALTYHVTGAPVVPPTYHELGRFIQQPWTRVDADTPALLPLLLPFCHITTGNVASEALFSSLGFQVVGTSDWVVSDAPAPRLDMHVMPMEGDAPVTWEALLLLINEAYAVTEGDLLQGPRMTPEQLHSAKRAGEFHVAISHDVGADACTRQSVPVGCFRIARVAASPAIAEVSLLAVAPAIQRAGVAQRLLRHALLLADAMPDVTHVQVKVLSSKPWLIRWYAHAGFTEVAMEAFAGAPLKPGVTQSLQLHVMQLSL